MPTCQNLRRKLARAHATLAPLIENRNANEAFARAARRESPFDDLVEWWETEIGLFHDHAKHQLTLTVVTTHRTSDLLQQTMIDIASHPELLDPLREEAIDVLGTQRLKRRRCINSS
ncbi:Cytochrome P450 monooxygenase eqxH [Colletotrichum trifolii]|uniref:Cytochrome P450 monooxygenase eqxH n=1 Tax=Colletotrichum trifolii TaxID=5466 RepID=A0A4R8QIF2_COLTR|nr:Cytochrome P450 monooxygenase eqxH [Colletotrichum trifolii]